MKDKKLLIIKIKKHNDLQLKPLYEKPKMEKIKKPSIEIEFEDGVKFETDKEEIHLLQANRKIKGPISFGCRIGMCGTCKIEIEEGLENINPKMEQEEEFTSKPCERLACMCYSVKGNVKIKVVE